MKFLNYLFEWKITPTGIFLPETLRSVPWIYMPESGLWYIRRSIIYNNNIKKGKINKRYYLFTYSHLDLQGFNPDLQDYKLFGKIFGTNITIYNYYDIGSKKREYQEKKAIEAIYKYIPESK